MKMIGSVAVDTANQPHHNSRFRTIAQKIAASAHAIHQFPAGVEK